MQAAEHRRLHFAVLSVAWLLMQAFVFYRHGIVTGNEAEKYIGQADILLRTGSVSDPSMWLYSTQIFLIAGAIQFTGSLAPVVIIQLAVSAAAMFALYNTLRRFASSLAASIVTLVLILNYPFQSFNTFLYTESLFFNLSILLACYLFSIRTLTATLSLPVMGLLLLLCITRPSGLLLLPGVFLFYVFSFLPGVPAALKWVLGLAVAATFLFALNSVVGIGGELDFLRPFREEHIICGLPTTHAGESAAPSTLWSVLNYVVSHPGQFFELALKRSAAFFGLTRSYFSTSHNIYLLLYFLPAYGLAIAGIGAWWKHHRGILTYCVSAIFFTWATVMFTCDDWHNRFLLSVMPYFYILSLPVVERLVGKW